MATFELTCSALPAHAVCIGFDGREEISRPFALEVFLNIPKSDDLVLQEVLGAKATLKIELGQRSIIEIGDPPHEIHGIVADIELLRTSDANALYRVTLVPRMWELSLTTHSRIWTKRSIKDIVTEVLSEHGLEVGDDVEFRLTSSPAPEEHVSQYRESDLAFVTRWMEREGWYFFFDHQDGKDKLVIGDGPSAHVSVRSTALRYSPSSERDRSSSNLLLDFSADKRLVAGQVEVRDYDYGRPSSPVTGGSRAGKPGLGALVDYGARLFDSGEAKRIATVRAEELKARESAFAGKGAATLIYSGFLFTLDRHPRPEMNRDYLVTSVRHLGYQPSLGEAWGELLPLPKIPDVYRIEIRAVESDLQFRAPFGTPWPRVDGFENAVVDGPASSPYAQIDADGRYNVKFKYDEGTLRDGKASTWVRMAQPHGGTVEGFHMPLRKGTEVIVQFLAGDPDRPVITLVAPNAVTPSRVVASNHTQNVIQTGSKNWMVAEDRQGAEWFHLYSPGGGMNSSLYMGVPRAEGGFALTCPDAPAVTEVGANATELGPYSLQLRTDGNLEIYAGANINLNAGGSFQMRSQGGDFRTYSSADWFLDVHGPAIENYEDTMHYHVEKKATRKYDADYTLDVTGAVTRTYDDTIKTFVKNDATYVFGADHSETIAADHNETIGEGLFELVVGNQTTITKTKHDVKVTSAGQKVKIVGNQQRTINAAPKTETTAAVTWDVGGAMKLEVKGQYQLNAQKEVEITSSMKLELTLLKMDLAFGTFKDQFNGVRLALNFTNMLDVALMRISETQILDVGITGAAFTAGGVDATLQIAKIDIDSLRDKKHAFEGNFAFSIHI